MIDWSKIDTVLLDMDGTLLDLHFDNFFWLHYLPQRYSEIHGTDHEASRQTLITRFEAEKGTLQWYCLDYWSSELEVDIVALKREVKHLIRELPEASHFLSWLHHSQRRVVMVTNAHRDSLNLKLAHTTITPWFDRLISSHDFGYPKESQHFWHSLQETEPFDPERTLFIDDSTAVLGSAREYGIRHLLTLCQPDTRAPVRPLELLPYPSFHHYHEIMPSTAGTSDG